jgi:hypothetical protein
VALIQSNGCPCKKRSGQRHTGREDHTTAPGENGTRKPRRGLRRNQAGHCLNLRLTAPGLPVLPGLWEDNFCSLTHPLYGTLFWQLKKLMQQENLSTNLTVEGSRQGCALTSSIQHGSLIIMIRKAGRKHSDEKEKSKTLITPRWHAWWGSALMESTRVIRTNKRIDHLTSLARCKISM